MTKTRTAITLSIAALAGSALVLTGCGGSSNSSSSSAAPASTSAAPTSSSAAPAPTDSPIGGGSAACDEATFEKLAQEAAAAAGQTLVDTKSYACADGWGIVFANTTQNNIKQTTAYVWEAEGPNWVPQTLDTICGDNPNGAPADIVNQACALR